MKEASYYKKLEDKKVFCFLCHQFCTVSDGEYGFCRVRKNVDGILYTLVYGKLIAHHVDPVEKKPLFHFQPGSFSFSIAAAGCNFRCLHCQNADISQPERREVGLGENVFPAEIVSMSLTSGCKSISYTYTEPTIFFEYAFETAKLAKKAGLKNIFVTNGYMSKQILCDIKDYLDAANVDLKSFSGDFYQKVCSAKTAPVLENLKLMKKYGIWLEITTLIIPSLNDDEKNLKNIADFIYEELGKEIPWHISAFYPAYKLKHLRPAEVDILHRAVEIGKKRGLYYVYSGNVPGDIYEHTYCYNCQKLLIERYGCGIINNVMRGNKCGECGAKIAGVF